MPNSLYIHIPFCRRKCTYCNFYSVAYDHSLADPYMDIIISQLNSLEPPYTTIYIGGGTPTVIGTRLMDKLLMAVGRLRGSDCEFTVEANPESMSADIVKTLRSGGVNRLSVGVQSVIDKKLKSLGRLHDYRKAKDSVLFAAKAGFANMSMDLIFGVWGETVQSWKKDLDEAVRLPVKHISCYELTYEKGTPLFDTLQNKSIDPVNDDVSSDMYELAIDTLSLRGFKQYEVSNFAVAGYESRHNMNYWQNGSYTGLGASAFSYIDGTRSRNVSDVAHYIKLCNSGASPVDFSEKLSPVAAAKETAAVKIRTKEGIDFAWFRARTGYDLLELEKKALPRLIEDGFIKYKRQGDAVIGISCLRKGFLHCDTVSSALL